MKYAIPFKDIRNKDIAIVGGKNASLGEMIHELGPLGIRIPDGFATTADAFRLFLKENNLIDSLNKELKKLVVCVVFLNCYSSNMQAINTKNLSICK